MKNDIESRESNNFLKKRYGGEKFCKISKKSIFFKCEMKILKMYLKHVNHRMIEKTKISK